VELHAWLTAQRWLHALGATYTWIEVPAYSGNAVKRLSHKPKGYLVDTGLAAFLQRLSGPAAVEVSPLCERSPESARI
jgi:uncharacterized protein